MSKAKVSDILSEIFKKIGSKENTKEVSSVIQFNLRWVGGCKNSVLGGFEQQ